VINQEYEHTNRNIHKRVDGFSIQNEMTRFKNNIIDTYIHKFKKENTREITFDTRQDRRDQFKKL
jgi:hypothetical protein